MPNNILNRKIAPAIKDAIHFELQLPKPAHYLLKNGVPVYEINTGAQPVAQIEFVFYAGSFYENQKSVAAATNALIKNGTKSKTAYELNEAFDFYGAFCSRSCHTETAVIKLNSLSKDLNALLPIVAEMLTEATYPQEELDTYKQNSLQHLALSLSKSDFVASRLIDSYVYGDDHPYGAYTNKEDIENLTADALQAFYKKYYTHGKCVVFASGRFEQNVQELLNKYFGYLPLQPANYVVPQQALCPLPEKKHRIVNDANSVQGAIRLARPFITREHEDFKKMMLLNTVYGGYFGSRLMSNIREEKGYTYGVYSYAENNISHSALVISTDAGKDVCEAAINEMYQEMDILKNEVVGDEELSLVKNYMIGSILGTLDGPFHIMAKWKNIILNQLDEQFFYDSINAIKNTTAPELQHLAQKYFNKEEFYDLVVY